VRMRLVLPVLLAAGCTVGPTYETPLLDSSGAWEEKVEAGPLDLARWWTIFQDPVLDRLVEVATKSNHDLRIAEARIREARAQFGVAAGALLPQIDGSFSASQGRESANGLFAPPPGNSPYSTDFRGGFDASWEIDLFGGIRRGLEAAGAEIEASIQDRNAVLVSLLGEVARNYIQVRGAQRQRAVVRGNVQAAKGTVDLTKSRLAAGVATSLDVARAEAQLASVTSEVPTVERALKESVHRLGVLLGKEPRALAAELSGEAPIPVPPERIVAGMPSELLKRRPDVRRAERALAAATARIGEAEADLYPKFSLLGSFGSESVEATDFFHWPSRTWSMGPSVRWPIFQAGRLQANVAVQSARQEQARAVFEKSFLLALEEVENALVAYFRERERHGSLEEAVAANRRAVALAEDLQRKGLVSFLDVLDSQRALYAAEGLLAQSDAGVSINLVALYKALGGGWIPDVK
jgi:multidrug efflux system outer membrane protein